MNAPAPFSAHTNASPIIWRGEQPVAFAHFVADVMAAAAELPDCRYAINVCEERYAFMVALLAVAVRGQTNLLPPGRLNHTITELAGAYSDCYCLSDSALPGLELRQHILTRRHAEPAAAPTPIAPIADDHVAVIAFTSGSTGRPTPNAKTWSSLVTGAHLAHRRFGTRAGHTVVPTVPAQHMYGLETSVLWPLVCGLSVCNRRPFFPEDIRAALESVPAPRVLVTSPVHLRVCAEAGLTWPAVDFVISATAPLPRELATASERALNTRVYEIYGCTEAGSLASRRTVENVGWQLYDGFSLQQRGANFFLDAAHIEGPVRLSDDLEIMPDASFKLLGRHSDQVNIAGKRTSLAELNRQLSGIEGVLDGVFVMPDHASGVQRLGALFVSGTLSERDVLTRLAERIDAAFIPRPLRRLHTLPRNDIGKLPHERLLALLEDPAAESGPREATGQ